VEESARDDTRSTAGRLARLWADRFVVATRRYGVEIEFIRDDAREPVVARVALPPAAARELAMALSEAPSGAGTEVRPARSATRGPSVEYALWIEGARLAQSAGDGSQEE
jgi:hypothetical protein